ncbi:hypothetical protein [Intrasporangium flavum]|uniref:hypothetical protein n=1 Tax=Intrasporangium flavum TaxID=1428657 RepID=UPI00096F8171|nr:hypothetical protein [Intrasporangium flavum]
MKRRFLVQTPVRRRVSALAAGLALAAVTAGCQVNSPVQTDVAYVPADGVPADVGQLAVRNLVLVGDGTGQAVVTGSAINLGTDPMTVKFVPQAAQGATAAPSGSEVPLGPREQVDLAGKGLQLSGVTAKPGTLVPVTITSSTGGTTVAQVPVLPPDGYYSTATPAPTGTTTG